MRSLTDIVIEVERYDDDKHTEISIKSVIYDATLDENAADFGYPTDSQLFAAATQLAGILARVAFRARPWVAYEAQKCRCPQNLEIDQYCCLNHYSTDICNIDGPDSMLTPSSDLGDTPAVWIYVPNASVDAWLERIRGWLEAATTADAYRVEDDPAESPQLRSVQGGTS